MEEILENGLAAFLEAEGQYGDLTAEELTTFEATLQNSRMQELIRGWWVAYDEERAAGNIAKAGQFWEPA